MRVKENEEAQTMTLEVADDGPGMTEEELAAVRNFTMVPKGNGIGLKNISERLNLIFSDAVFEISSQPGKGTVVRIENSEIWREINVYKLLIVDDEDVEREGMADFIQWEKYGISLAGTAWNGVEGYEEIQNQMPDIVITDIKMPVMNGIELIRKTREDFPDIVFIVLSGYGEYEYTSRAVELGVRHYILKPCDEAKIVEVIGKVTEELKVREEKKRKEVDMRTQVKRLAPRAREQMFRNVLLNREDIHKDFEAYLGGCGIFSKEVFLLAFHKETWFDYLEQFVVSNIITELLGSGHVLLVTSIRNDVLLLLDGRVFDEIQPVIVKVKKEYEKFDSSPLQTAVSGRGSWGQIHGLYEEVSGLFKDGKDRGGHGRFVAWIL